METSQIDITVEDGSTAITTHSGKVTLIFTSGKGKDTKLILHRVIYFRVNQVIILYTTFLKKPQLYYGHIIQIKSVKLWIWNNLNNTNLQSQK
eukprot:4764951-Ditylum_brightwellii.AAC.1